MSATILDAAAEPSEAMRLINDDGAETGLPGSRTSCCGPSVQAACCEPSAKSSCCGSASVGGCGCRHVNGVVAPAGQA